MRCLHFRRCRFDPLFDLEVWKPESAEGLSFSLIRRSTKFFKTSNPKVRRFKPEFTEKPARRKVVRLECGSELPVRDAEGNGKLLTSDASELLLRRFPDSWEARFEDATRAKLAVSIPTFSQSVVGLKISTSDKAKTKKPIKLHFVQRTVKAKQIVGGVAVQLTVGGRNADRKA